MRFEGEQTFDKPRDVIWGKLSDASFLVQCIPDAVVEGTPEPKKAVCTVRPGFSFVRGSIELSIQVRDAVEKTALAFDLLSKGIGSSVDVASHLTLEDADGGTRVRWNAEVTRLGGLLKAVPSGLIRGAAQKVINDVWVGIAEKM